MIFHTSCTYTHLEFTSCTYTHLELTVLFTVLWGHLAILADHNFPTHSTLHDYFAARAKEFDGTYRLHLPLWPVIPGHSVWHTSDVSNVEHILKSNFENYIKVYDSLSSGPEPLTPTLIHSITL